MATLDASPSRSVFRHRDFTLYQVARLCAVLAVQIESVAIGWQVYELTGSALALGYTGLAQFLPFLAFALVGGQVADRVDRRAILAVCQGGMLLCSLLLLVFSLGHIRDVRFVYGRGPGSRDPDWNADGTDYPERFLRWTARSNLEALLHLQATGRVDVAPLLTHRFPVDRAGEAADLLVDHPDQALGVVITYGVPEAPAPSPSPPSGGR